MALEQVIGDRLRNDGALAAMLAVYAGRPAVFDREAPDDTDPNWKNGVQYARVIYLLDRSTGSGDIMTGSLHVTIWARDALNEFNVDQVAVRIHALLDQAAMYAPEDGLAVTTSMPRVTPLPATAGAQRVMGVDIAYSVQFFPPNTTYEPDPVATMMRWSGDHLDHRIKVTPGAWAPGDSSPALYWRVTRGRTMAVDLEWWGFWVDVDMVAHVLAPSAYARGVWARYIADVLRLPTMRSIRMGDNSPLRVMQVEMVPTASALTQGQLNLRARYGVMSRQVPTGLDNPPALPGTDIEPPPVIVPPTIYPPVFADPIDWVSDIDTHQVLDSATLEVDGSIS